MLVIHWRILSYFSFTLIFLLISIALTITNTILAYLCDFRVGRLNVGTFVTAPTACHSGYSGSSMSLSCSMSNSLYAVPSSSLSFGLWKLLFQLSQFSVTERLSCALSSSLLTGWWLILLIQWTFTISVWHPGRSFVDKAGGNGDFPDNLNAAARSGWKSDQGPLKISSVSEMNPLAVIYFFWSWTSSCIADRFWLRCHISNKSWTLAILCNFLATTWSKC
jgi:hypothetical protein